MLKQEVERSTLISIPSNLFPQLLQQQNIALLPLHSVEQWMSKDMDIAELP